MSSGSGSGWKMMKMMKNYHFPAGSGSGWKMRIFHHFHLFPSAWKIKFSILFSRLMEPDLGLGLQQPDLGLLGSRALGLAGFQQDYIRPFSVVQNSTIDIYVAVP